MLFSILLRSMEKSESCFEIWQDGWFWFSPVGCKLVFLGLGQRLFFSFGVLRRNSHFKMTAVGVNCPMAAGTGRGVSEINNHWQESGLLFRGSGC